MPNNAWISALREWNDKHNTKGSWCVPKKGTADYDQVRGMMKATPAAAAKPSRTKRQTPTAPPPEQGYWVRGDDGKRKWVKSGSGIKEV